jgi:hypothetical protein
VVTLLSTLSQEVKDLAAQLDPAKDAATQTKLNDFATRLDAKTDALAAAVAANTPASP